MAVTLRKATHDDREPLRRLLADYLFEFDGRAEPYPYFDAYWRESERLPFVIEAEGEVVGLRLIRARDGGWDIAEFSITPDRRRQALPFWLAVGFREYDAQGVIVTRREL